MNEEHTIIQQVYAAKTDNQAADRLIGAYMPFIKAETAKFLKRPPASQDDELSIAMIAFHEAIQGYSRMRGTFLKYASITGGSAGTETSFLWIPRRMRTMYLWEIR